MAVLRSVAKTDTFEIQRQKINQIAQDVYNVQSSVGEGAFSMDDGSVQQPALFFTSQNNLGLYKSSVGTLNIASTNKNVASFSDSRIIALKPFSVRANAIGNLGAGSIISILSAGSNYLSGTYNGINLTGGTGEGATANITISGFGGSVTNQGSGYTPGTYSNVSLSNGSGIGATANITIPGITGTISGGSNYTNGTYSNIPLTGGSGTGAQATIQVSGGAVSSVVITNNGNLGYVNGNVLSASSSNIGGTGSGFTFTINNNPFKILLSNITFVSYGSGYLSGDVIGVSSANVGGTGSGFAYTISSVGTLTNIQLVNGGTSYSLNDILSFNPNDLAASETYAVTVANTQLLVFSGTLPTSGFTVGGNVTIGATTKTILKRFTSGSNITAVIVNTSSGAFNSPDGQTATSGAGTATVQSNTIANQYFFDLNDGNGAQLTPNITLLKNKTYVFSSQEFISHPFFFSTTADGTHGGGTQYTGAEVTVGQTTVTIKPNNSTPSTLYIYCSNHPNMAGYDNRELVVTVGADYVAPGSGAQIKVDSILSSDSFAVTLSGNVTAANISGASLSGTSLSINGQSTLSGLTTVNSDLNVSNNLTVSKSSNIEDASTVQKYFTINPVKLSGTGTISTSTNSTSVSGFSTSFISELMPGDHLYNSSGKYIGVIAGISNNTSLTLEDNATISQSALAFKYARELQLFSNYKTGFIGIHKSVPEYDLDINGTLANSLNAILASSQNSKLVVGDESLVLNLNASDKVYVEGNIISSTNIIASSTGDVKAPSFSFTNNERVGFSSNSNSNTLSITGVSGELGKFASEEINFYRNTNFTHVTISDYVITPGSGYIDGNYSNVLLTGGTGKDLYANLTVAFSTTITNPGTGYSIGSYNSVPLTGGSGNGAIANISISSGSVYDINITDGGSGYETAPTVTFIGNGTGATGIANLTESGTVKTIGVVSSGSNYTSAPVVIIGTEWTSSNTVSLNQQYFSGTRLYTVTTSGITGSTAPTHTSGSVVNGTCVLTYAGEIAQANAVIGSTAGVDLGTIISINVTQSGSGYTQAPNISFNGGGGANASAVAKLQYEVQSVTITNPGENYSTPPSVEFTSLTGSGASASSLITNTGVSSVIVTNAGSGYQIGDELSFDHTSLIDTLGVVSSAPSIVATLEVVNLGSVTQVNVVNDGNGYKEGDILYVPSITGLSSGSGFSYTINSVTEEDTVKIDKKLGSITANYINTIGSGILIDDSLSIDGTTITSTQNNGITLTPGSSSALLSINGTGGIKVPVGTSTNRPSATTLGIIRYNSQTQQYEGSNGSNFISLGGVRDVDGNTYIVAEEETGANDNILYFFNDADNSARLNRNELELVTATTISSKDTDGKFKWKASTLYNLNAFVYQENNLYQVTVAGTTGLVPPSHTTGSTTNGTATLNYIGTTYGDLTFKANNINLDGGLTLSGSLNLYSLNDNLIFENSDNSFKFAFGNNNNVPNIALSITNTGALLINKNYNTLNAENNINIIDYTAKFIELDDVKIQTSDLTLSKGGTETGNINVYDPDLYKGAKVIIIAENTSSGDSHIVEYNIISKGTDIYVNEYGNLDTGIEQYSIVWNFNPSGDIQGNITLSPNLSAGNNVIITSAITKIKK